MRPAAKTATAPIELAMLTEAAPVAVDVDVAVPDAVRALPVVAVPGRRKWLALAVESDHAYQ